MVCSDELFNSKTKQFHYLWNFKEKCHIFMENSLFNRSYKLLLLKIINQK